ncbi:MAG: hypothetical protein Q4G59_07755 [Planctomycetia bacterium]|nr:hypothetical protein [Planctomycetia bacterium]
MWKNQGDELQFVPVARVSEIIDVVWKPGTPTYRRGQYIEPCKLEFEKGIVKLDMIDKAQLLLEGPCDFMVMDTMHSFCIKGRASVTILSGGKGFEIKTPLARYIDQGTKFYLDVQDVKDELTVIEGSVDHVPFTGNPERLMQGNARRILLAKTIETISVEPNRFLDDNRFLQKLEQASAVVLATRQEGSQRYNDDPNLLVRFDFDTTDGKTAVNRSNRGRNLIPNAVIHAGKVDEVSFTD